MVWMDNVVLLKDAPNRANAIKFMDFLLEPENIAAVTNYTRSAAGVEGVTDLLDEELKTSPESVPPADAPPGTFIAVCDQEAQEVYDAIWTRPWKAAARHSGRNGSPEYPSHTAIHPCRMSGARSLSSVSY